ncbi:cell division protein FtsL [Methylomonas sp. MO1]|jgi:cell division protein FtsL|uniref:Cell division protein FtsL n=5 Tax=Methylomonas TaxID=416 RepID=A0A126T5C0_9GAMM|nr:MULTISPECIES: cell division protein FtsL [Methylomonas]OQW73347.1 MAG: cell division protein FtsL [Proteobacteria bacterium ST_bin11]AMK77250.1 cell division protein FtsL [Methylomonas denitrificans]MBD9359250.1 cell division protein FtsL [Methylomonas fluvii]MCQ8116212.1 cell division protein FtsL [Methylomonas sp. WSC-7]MDT4289850.1 cell division protein FtsL [Methylomonas sp. MO1]
MAIARNILLTLLVAMLMISGIAVIYSKYQSRLLFIDIQKKEKELDDYEVEWGRLQLELTTLTEENRVEIEARTRLMLTLPAQDKIIYIKP